MMKKFCRTICCILCFVLFPGVFGHGAPRRNSADIEDSFLGVQSNLNYSGRVPNANDYALMDSIAATGVKWVRYWLCWYQVEVDSGEYYFTAADSAIEGYTSRGMNVYLTLSSGNQWYDGPDSSVYDSVAHPEMGLSPTPGSASMQGWLKFVDTAVVRYQDKVKYWDIWNEPNIDYWQPKPNPQHYAHLLKLTSQKIKSINSSAIIIGLGTSTIDFEYISDVLQEDIIDDIDFLGFHPYRLFPEDDQDNMGLWYQPAPYRNYCEEMQGLLDTLAKYDPSGRVQLWDEEAGYPSQPEIFIWTPDTVYSSDSTQAKYLLRRFIMNLGFNVGVTTWFYDWDQVSAYPSILGPTWYQHYYNADWYEKEVPFQFNYLGLTYSSPADTLVFEAEAYDSLYPPLKDAGAFLYTNDGDGDLQGSAVYYINVPDSGLYTLWLSVRNPDETAAFLAYVDDTLPHWVTNALDTGTGIRYIWSLPLNVRLIRWHYLYRGRFFFDLNAGTHRVKIQTGVDGGSVDKFVIKREGPMLTLKPSYYAFKNLASLFDNQVVSDSGLGVSFENIDVPIADWNELRSFTFRDTSSDISIISYWLGLKAVDDLYPNYYLKITVDVDSVTTPRVINLFDGSITQITDFIITDSSVIFDSLPVSDFPYCLVFDDPIGIEEIREEIIPEPRFSAFPNPFSEFIEIKFQLAESRSSSGNLELKIYDVSGRLVRDFGKLATSQSNQVTWNGTDDNGREVAAGIYFCRFEIDDFRSMEKLILLR